MKRAQWIAFAGLAVFAALILLLVLRNPPPPPLPQDPDHVWRDAEPCIQCHDTEGMLPRSPNHPVGRDCLRCHGPAP